MTRREEHTGRAGALRLLALANWAPARYSPDLGGRDTPAARGVGAAVDGDRLTR